MSRLPRAAATAAGAFLAAVAAILVIGRAQGMHDRPAHPVTPVLMYHHVGDWGPSNPGWADWVVRPEVFRRQLDWLKANGYRTVTFRELERERAGGPRPEGEPVVITFDDGWAEHEHWLRTELEPRGMRGVLFVFTGAVGPTRNGGGYISWEQLRELEAAGHEVQSHTVSHAVLAGLPPGPLERELADSRAAIEANLGHPCRVLAYPYGRFDPAAAAAAARAGYERAFRADGDAAVAPPLPLCLPRIRVGYDDSIEVFAERVRTRTSPAGR